MLFNTLNFFTFFFFLDYMEFISSTCEKSNIKYVFFRTPLYKHYYDNIMYSHHVEDYITTIAKKYKCKFIDFQKLQLADDKLNHKDEIHLNETGVKLFSVFLAHSIMKN